MIGSTPIRPTITLLSLTASTRKALPSSRLWVPATVPFSARLSKNSLGTSE